MAISRHDLVPMPLAARMLYQRAYGDLPPPAHLDDRLNGLAYVLARSGGMYVMMDEGRKTPRRLSRDELTTGHFRLGGKELHFLDERAPLVHLGVTPACIAKAVALLLAEAEKN